MSAPSIVRACAGLLAGLASVLVAALLRLLPGLAEFYAATLGPAASWILTRLNSLLPFALSEWLLLGLLLVLLLRSIIGWRRARGSGHGRLRILGRGTLAGLNLAGWIVAAFLWFWGFHYSRPPLEDRWELPELDASRLQQLCTLLVDLANEHYEELHGSEDAGQPTPHVDGQSLDRALEESFAELRDELKLGPSVAWQRGSAKRPRISPLMNHLGISGFYFPWSGEANVNAELPAIAYAHALAHEKAHQRGFAPEDEANFVAILAGASAEHPLGRYSGILFAQRQLLRNLLMENPEAGQELLARRHAGVQRDVDDLRAFWARYRGRAREWAHRSNDLYLRAQRVEGGTASYAGSAELLLRFAATAEDFPPIP